MTALNSSSRIGLLLVNLGTPDEPSRPALRRYLAEFLWDPRVVEVPRPIWWLILHGVILNIRPKRSAQAYQRIWMPEGSPLLVHSQALMKQMVTHIPQKKQFHCALAMRYGSPSIAETISQLMETGIDTLITLPLYPQYSATTTGSAFDGVSAALQRMRRIPNLLFIDNYHDHPAYIEAMAHHIQNYWKKNGKGRHLLISFHGIPQRYAEAGDPYPQHCLRSARLLTEKLELTDDEWTLGFQSRFGREAWLQPYVVDLLKKWPKAGIQDLDVFCPGFATDCLETIDEMGHENQQLFLSAGGTRYRYIPALNADTAHANALWAVVCSHLACA